MAGDGPDTGPTPAGRRRRADGRVDPARRPADCRADLLAFLDAGTPPVYAGFSSVRAPEDAARVAIEAIRSQGRRVVVSRGWADLALIDDLDDCFVVGEVNLQALFARVAAVVHHGGAGTTTTATRAGAAQVVVPQIADQPYWARPAWRTSESVWHTRVRLRPWSRCRRRFGLRCLPRSAAVRLRWLGMIRTDGAAEAARQLGDAEDDAAP